MQVDRDRVARAFRECVSAYDASDEKVRLKIAHTYKVAALSEGVARSISLDEGDCDLAWLIGMLHDIGRFEHVRRSGTFFDASSIDHAELGADLLFNEGLIGGFVDECDPVVETAIRMHNRLAIDPYRRRAIGGWFPWRNSIRSAITDFPWGIWSDRLPLGKSVVVLVSGSGILEKHRDVLQLHETLYVS